jgi:hypothetical protein
MAAAAAARRAAEAVAALTARRAGATVRRLRSADTSPRSCPRDSAQGALAVAIVATQATNGDGGGRRRRASFWAGRPDAPSQKNEGLRGF